MAKTQTKHSAGDELFKNSTTEAKKLHEQFKKSTRVAQRSDFMKQRSAQNSQFQR